MFSTPHLESGAGLFETGWITVNAVVASSYVAGSRGVTRRRRALTKSQKRGTDLEVRRSAADLASATSISASKFVVMTAWATDMYVGGGVTYDRSRNVPSVGPDGLHVGVHGDVCKFAH
jgi:hypothetical protein